MHYNEKNFDHDDRTDAGAIADVLEDDDCKEAGYNGYCEDYPCCGHTPQDPCARQEYDEPGYYDTTIKGHEHRLCDHENGDCIADDYYGDEDW